MSPLKQPKLQRHLFLFSIDFKGCTWVSADFRHWSFSFFLSRSRQTSFTFKGIPCFKVDIQTPRPEMKTFWLSQKNYQSNFWIKAGFQLIYSLQNIGGCPGSMAHLLKATWDRSPADFLIFLRTLSWRGLKKVLSRKTHQLWKVLWGTCIGSFALLLKLWLLVYGFSCTSY